MVAIFKKALNMKTLYYINTATEKRNNPSLNLKLIPIVNCLKQLAVGIFLCTHTAICNTMRSIFLSFNLNYESEKC